MRVKKFVLFLLAALIASFATTVMAQQNPEEEVTRGSFLTTRPPAPAGGSVGGGVSVSASSSSNKSSGKSTSTSSSKSSSKSRTKTKGKSTSKGTTTTVAVKTYSSAPIGLGYTLYMRNSMGDAVRIDPSREFRAGDRIRISMEANTDGYLYVFHTENDNAPTMIFPDSRLNGGDNSIDAHVPYEVPSPFEASENLRWFLFNETPAMERLYIVITRQPLPAILIGKSLVAFCDGNPNSCPLRMSPTVWANIKQSNGQVRVSTSRSYGQTQTEGERNATTRGLGLDQSAPEPTVVRMNVSTTAGILVTTLDLVHN